jgi:hypothetical protein
MSSEMRTVLLMLATFAAAQDTQQLATALEKVRSQEVLSPGQYREIQSLYIRWIDTRVESGESIDAMNRELNKSGLLVPEMTSNDPWHIPWVGHLDKIENQIVGDSVVIEAGIFSNAACGLNQTAMVYDSNGRRGLGTIAPGDAMEWAYAISNIAVGPDSSGERLAAAGWFMSACASSWNGAAFTIHRVTPNGVVKILDRHARTRQLDQIKLNIAGNVVEFHYIGRLGDVVAMARTGIAKYRIEGNRATRIAPLALSIPGFMDEWLDMDESEAARWSTPAAARMHAQAKADYGDDVFEWQTFGRCGGAAELGIQFTRTKKIDVFRISGATAADLKMIGISDKHSCAARDISGGDLTEVLTELPN